MGEPGERCRRRGNDLLGKRLRITLELRHAGLGHVAAGALYCDGERGHVVSDFRVRGPHPRRPLEPSIHMLEQELLEPLTKRDQRGVHCCHRYSSDRDDIQKRTLERRGRFPSPADYPCVSRCTSARVISSMRLHTKVQGPRKRIRRAGGKYCERSRCQRSTLSSTISARNLPCSAVIRPTVMGRRKRRGPALPGLKKSVPFFVSILGWCE